MNVTRRVALVLAALLLASCGGGGGGDDDAAGVKQAPGPRVVSAQAAGGRVVNLKIDSPAVGRTVGVRLLLPRDYDREPARRWPVLYLLHGCCDSYQSWTRSTDVERLSARDDVLVVMPDGGRAGFYSDWRQGPAWERFHLTELRQILERHYRAGDPRAVAGLSMGGFGAMSYAARHPRFFRAAASYSGLLDLRRSTDDEGVVAGITQSEGEDPDALWGDPDRDAARWKAHNPRDLATRLRGTRLFVSSGTGRPGPLDPRGARSDPIEPVVLRETASFVVRLRALGIPARVDLYGPGTHSWPYWQRELHRSWPLLMGAVGA
jgi:S-formylglutathione hydrolase FrmB